jgi:signal transduction histidine kinase
LRFGQRRYFHCLPTAFRTNELIIAQIKTDGNLSTLGRETKDHFLAVLSHELRTPLMPVLLGVETLMLDRDLRPRESTGAPAS